MKIAICDDEKNFIDHTCEMLEKWAKKQNIRLELYRFTDGYELVQTHRMKGMDLILLDVLMPLFNGIDTAKELRNYDLTVPIVFLTSSKEYAVDSYDVNAFHYLLKPVQEQRLYAVLDDFSKLYYRERKPIVLHGQLGYCRITPEDVVYLEAQNKHVIAYLSNGTSIRLAELFSRCEQMFTLECGFFKCHRSYLVNMNCVETFSKTEINTHAGSRIPISRNCYPEFKKTYFSYMFQ